MIDILGIKFISDKEASERYGYSQSWFQHRRLSRNGPPYVKMIGKGKVLYNLENTDNWFKENMKEMS